MRPRQSSNGNGSYWSWPTRVRWRNDGHDPNDLAELERQQTSESVPKRPILATCSQNSEAVDPVSSQRRGAGKSRSGGSSTTIASGVIASPKPTSTWSRT